MEQLLDKYARLVARIGANIQRGQQVVINAPIECADFARRIARKAYGIGAHDVTMAWNDEQFSHLRFQLAQEQVFTEFPQWRRMLYLDHALQGAAFVTIHAENPELFRDVDPERLTLAQKAAGLALLEYRQRLMSNKNAWCVVSVPTAGWAAKVFPKDAPQEAMARLWHAIFQMVRIDRDSDPEENWQRHTAFLQKAADFLNGHAFRALHYRNGLGTNLRIGLPEGHLWAGGAEYTEGKVRFVANMPTEEVYTLPLRDEVDGIAVATRPMHCRGNLIEDFRLEFRAGKVIDFHASKGENVLKELLATDEGASHLGEVALVPYDSPISRSGLLFFNTLFDENASCHLALGKAYPTCLGGGEAMSSKELLEHGVNDSLVHEDFMIGTSDLEIVGIKQNGERLPVFTRGNFAF